MFLFTASVHLERTNRKACLSVLLATVSGDVYDTTVSARCIITARLYHIFEPFPPFPILVVQFDRSVPALKITSPTPLVQAVSLCQPGDEAVAVGLVAEGLPDSLADESIGEEPHEGIAGSSAALLLRKVSRRDETSRDHHGLSRSSLLARPRYDVCTGVRCVTLHAACRFATAIALCYVNAPLLFVSHSTRSRSFVVVLSSC